MLKRFLGKGFPGKDHGSLVLPWFTLGLGAIIGLLFLGFGVAPAGLVLDQDAVRSGEIWRLITGHLVHSDITHLGWNLGALLALGIAAESVFRLSVQRMLWATILGMVAVDIIFLTAMPNLDFYCGFSAILNTWFGLIVLIAAFQSRDWVLYGLLIGAGLKIAVEWLYGGSLLGVCTWQSVPPLHAVGYGVGLILASLKIDMLKRLGMNSTKRVQPFPH